MHRLGDDFGIGQVADIVSTPRARGEQRGSTEKSLRNPWVFSVATVLSSTPAMLGCSVCVQGAHVGPVELTLVAHDFLPASAERRCLAVRASRPRARGRDASVSSSLLAWARLGYFSSTTESTAKEGGVPEVVVQTPDHPVPLSPTRL